MDPYRASPPKLASRELTMFPNRRWPWFLLIGLGFVFPTGLIITGSEVVELRCQPSHPLSDDIECSAYSSTLVSSNQTKSSFPRASIIDVQARKWRRGKTTLSALYAVSSANEYLLSSPSSAVRQASLLEPAEKLKRYLNSDDRKSCVVEFGSRAAGLPFAALACLFPLFVLFVVLLRVEFQLNPNTRQLTMKRQRGPLSMGKHVFSLDDLQSLELQANRKKNAYKVVFQLRSGKCLALDFVYDSLDAQTANMRKIRDFLDSV